MSEHNIGVGDVELKLGEQNVSLKPTLQAAIKLSGVQGGITRMVDRCLNLEFDAIHTVIAQGLGGNSKDLPGLIYDAGLINLSDPCIRFLHNLANGGRPPANIQEGQEEGPLAKNSQ